MNAVKKIEEVLESSVLVDELLVVPDRGATEAEIAAEEHLIGRTFSGGFSEFLRKWNGANLDVIVIFGCGETHPEIPALRDRQTLLPCGIGQAIVIGSDPAGFVFAEARNRQIVSIDTKGGGHEVVGSGFADFVSRFVFGEDSHLFCDEDWQQELRGAGLLR